MLFFLTIDTYILMTLGIWHNNFEIVLSIKTKVILSKGYYILFILLYLLCFKSGYLPLIHKISLCCRTEFSLDFKLSGNIKTFL